MKQKFKKWYKNLFSPFQIILPISVLKTKYLILVLAVDLLDRHCDIHTEFINEHSWTSKANCVFKVQWPNRIVTVNQHHVKVLAEKPLFAKQNKILAYFESQFATLVTKAHYFSPLLTTWNLPENSSIRYLIWRCLSSTTSPISSILLSNF